MGLFCFLVDEFYYEILLFCYSLYGFSMTSLFSVFSGLAFFFLLFFATLSSPPGDFFICRSIAPPLARHRYRSGGLGWRSSIARRRMFARSPAVARSALGRRRRSPAVARSRARSPAVARPPPLLLLILVPVFVFSVPS